MGVSSCRSWSRFIAFEAQKSTTLLEVDFSDTPAKGLAWSCGFEALELKDWDIGMRATCCRFKVQGSGIRD